MDDAAQIDHLIDVMKQLQQLEKMLAETNGEDLVLLSMILALIKVTQVPNVTILSNNRGMAQA
jgi:glutaredoxin|tara:strand:+ start:803 stop:991 length:189 start_codon:yes stop_codon:yes gene_type:complete